MPITIESERELVRKMASELLMRQIVSGDLRNYMKDKQLKGPQLERLEIEMMRLCQQLYSTEDMTVKEPPVSTKGKH